MARRPAPGRQKRQPLNRERVLREAVALADARGVEALSMRELGRHLGVEAMSLYNHVDSKDDLLNGIVDLVVAEMELPAGDVDWRQAMHARAQSARQVFARHPWASQMIDTRTSSGPERLRYLDWMIGTLRGAGFTVEQALHAISAIDSYVYGFARQQSTMTSADAGTPESAEEFLSQVPTDLYPHLSEVILLSIEQGYDPEADFDFGLALFLDGLERLRT